MSFFNKMKQGASEAAKKAQQTMETTKLRVQLSSKEKEIEKLSKLIGEAVYQAYMAGDWRQAEKEIVTYCEQVGIQYQEVQSIESKINQAKQVKECRCGSMVASHIKFCPGCGYAFPEHEEAAAAELYVRCPACRSSNDTDAKICTHCGASM